MPDPLYRTIAEALRQRIESPSADLHPGDQLPNEQVLGKQFGASRNTIREAIRWLINRGLVEARPGQGTFVSKKFQPFITTLSGDWQTEGQGLSGGEGNAALQEARDRDRTPVTSDPLVTPQFAEDVVAQLLRMPEGTGVIVRQQRRFLDDEPWSVLTSYYPMRYIEEGAHLLRAKSDIAEGAVAYLKDKLGIVQVGYRDQMIVRAPEDDEVKFFGLPDSGRVPVVVIYRTGFTKDSNGQPVPFRLTETVFPADRNQFVINAGDVDDRLAVPIVPQYIANA